MTFFPVPFPPSPFGFRRFRRLNPRTRDTKRLRETIGPTSYQLQHLAPASDAPGIQTKPAEFHTCFSRSTLIHVDALHEDVSSCIILNPISRSIFLESVLTVNLAGSTTRSSRYGCVMTIIFLFGSRVKNSDMTWAYHGQMGLVTTCYVTPILTPTARKELRRATILSETWNARAPKSVRVHLPS